MIEDLKAGKDVDLSRIPVLPSCKYLFHVQCIGFNTDSSSNLRQELPYIFSQSIFKQFLQTHVMLCRLRSFCKLFLKRFYQTEYDVWNKVYVDKTFILFLALNALNSSNQPEMTVQPQQPAPQQPVENEQPSSSSAPAEGGEGGSSGPPPPPQTIMEAFQQRLAKYQSAEATSKAEGNGSKARRMGRIVKVRESYSLSRPTLTFLLLNTRLYKKNK